MPALPRRLTLLREATVDGRRCDVVLAGDTVAAVLEPGTATAPAEEVLDLGGYLLLPAPAEPHAHLDKALSWDALEPPLGDLVQAIESWRSHTATMTEDSVAERARAQALRMLALGTTAVRTHVDILTTGDPLRGVRAVAGVRAELAGLMDVEIVCLAPVGAPPTLVAAALDAGADLVGGAPHLAEDPDDELHRLLDVAEARGAGTDLHTDEALDGHLTMRAFAARVRDWPADRVRTAGHAVRLGTLPPEELAAVVTEIVDSRISVVSLPITNLYLQGWEHPVSTPRGLTALRALLDAGVTVAAGADNVRDPFNPVGRSDALETASLLVTAGHLGLDEAYAAVSTGARRVMALPAAGVVPGLRADLLALRGTSLADVVANAPADRRVIHSGRLVSQTDARTETALPTARTLTPAR